MNLCVIPARGGSKRIPRKNIRDFCGKPMIAWSIEAAHASECFDRVIVSTDDDEIAKVARAWGAEVPFMRPVELADDHTGTIPVIAHATRWMMEAEDEPDSVCCLYPTAPLVQPDDIQQGLQALRSDTWAFCFTATEYASPIFRAFQAKASGGVEMFFPEHFQTRSQDLPTALHDAGQFYWGRPHAWLSHEALFGAYSTPLLIPRWRVVDIDTEADWQHAELMHRAAMMTADA